MERRRTRGKIASLIAAILLVALMAVPASAATTYTPVAGTSCTFNKYLIMDEGDSVPNVTFSFTVAPGTAIPADLTTTPKTMEVLAGIGTPTIADVTFVPGDATTLYAAAQETTNTDIDVKRAASDRVDTLTAATGVQLEAGEKYAKKEATISFTGITFPEPGIYRYIVTETASATDEAAGIMHDNDTDRVLDVYVTDKNDETGKLIVSAYVMHKNVGTVKLGDNYGSDDVIAAGNALADKTDGFTNEFNSKDLVFKKEVTGNQASRDKYFKFTVKLADVNDAYEYVVSIVDDNNAATTDGSADAKSGTTSATKTEYQNQTNPAKVTGAQLKSENGVAFYLQHGQSIAIRGIAPNATYTVTEDAEDYKSTASAVTGYTNDTTGVIGTVAGTNKAVKTSYKNEREGIIPTGILLSATPWIILGVVVVAGIVFFAVRSKKRYDEE